MKPTEIIRQLESNSQIFKSLMSYVSHEQIKWKPSEEKWSLIEIMCHLYDEEIKDFRARLDKIIHQDHNWDPIDPQGWVISGNYSGRNLESVLNDFLDERKKSVEWLLGLHTEKWDAKAVHPKLGEFGAYQMLCNWLAHDYLHIKQIVILKYLYLESGLGKGQLGYAGD